MHRFARLFPSSSSTLLALSRSRFAHPTSCIPWSKHARPSQTAVIAPPSSSAGDRTSSVEAPVASTMPSTAHALPLAGGDSTKELRASMHAEITHNIRKASLSPPAILHAADVVPSGPVVFVGVGMKTNWPGLLAALDAHAFGDRRVVIVRDVFDRSEDRQFLSDWFAVVADDVVAVDTSVVRAGLLRRRFVNEYVPGRDDNNPPHGYRLARNDVDLVEFLHSSGWRVVPVSSRGELRQLRDGTKPIPVQQSTNHVLACAPTAFNFNDGAAVDNYFMNAVSDEAPQTEGAVHLRRRVLTEFANLHAALVDRRDGVGAHVHLFTHEDWHNTPDACFPNNTFSTHTNFETGDACVLVLYPMRDETRRKERRLVQRLLTRGRYTQVYDLTREETAERPSFLEGTGSLVLDRINRVAYVALSQRSDLKLARAWGRVMGYGIVPFTSVDDAGRPIYHTNVMMAVGSRVAVVCGESIIDDQERHAVMSTLHDTGHDVIDISYKQVQKFCGNVIELESFYGEQMFVMSSGAHAAFTQEQRERMLNGVSRLVHADISTIEMVGGGGVRCTIAELF